MRTKDEVTHAFTPSDRLNEVQKNALLRTQMAFKDLATEMFDLAPETADRTAAFRKLLEAKMMFTQAITHDTTAVAPTPSRKIVSSERRTNA